jgi:hypothetical protein
VAVDGRFPETLGVLWFPRTACGGEADAVADASGPGDVTSGVGDSDRAGAPPEETAVADGEARAAAVGDGALEVDDGLGLALPVCRNPTWPLWTNAGTATTSAISPSRATSGTSGRPRPSGRRSRQFGQNPETGVVT